MALPLASGSFSRPSVPKDWTFWSATVASVSLME